MKLRIRSLFIFNTIFALTTQTRLWSLVGKRMNSHYAFRVMKKFESRSSSKSEVLLLWWTAVVLSHSRLTQWTTSSNRITVTFVLFIATSGNRWFKLSRLRRFMFKSSPWSQWKFNVLERILWLRSNNNLYDKVLCRQSIVVIWNYAI